MRKGQTGKSANVLPEWVGYLEDWFGVRATYGDKWQRWLTWMAESDGLGNEPSGNEILEALKHAHKKGSQAGDKFTVARLISWIKWYRKEQAAARHGYSPDSAEGNFGRIKNDMLHAETWRDRWNALCGDPDSRPRRNINECRELEMWARDRWPDWDERIAEMLKENEGRWET